ncbi:hypothetical protein [Arthrobacter sp. KK5.5]|uniref:hypothetical protein n=1 Tax=Arthrobacter sp. KK5.5 TaxID=3373084 RepID=UPI003EE623B7
MEAHIDLAGQLLCALILLGVFFDFVGQLIKGRPAGETQCRRAQHVAAGQA